VPSFEQARSKHKPTARTIEIIGDSELADQIDEAEQRRDGAKGRLPFLEDTAVRNATKRELDDAQVDLDKLLAEAEPITWRFRLRTIGQDRYEKLRLRHPPTTKQRDEAKDAGNASLDHNPETFPAALVAECLVEVTVGGETVEPFGCDETKQIYDDEDWSPSELVALFEMAKSVNRVRRVSLGKGSRTTPGSGASSPTASRPGSRSRRS
jgi:hypothetical protein